MDAKIIKSIQHIHQIEELDALLEARERMRRIYSDMQTVFLATENPLWATYLRLVAGAGKELSKDIAAWYARQAELFADYAPGEEPE